MLIGSAIFAGAGLILVTNTKIMLHQEQDKDVVTIDKGVDPYGTGGHVPQYL